MKKEDRQIEWIKSGDYTVLIEGFYKGKNIFDLRQTEYGEWKMYLVLNQICEDFYHRIRIYKTLNDAKRDAYLQKVVNAITEELFSGESELKVGEMCEVSDCRYSWVKRRLLAILPEHYVVRFITENDSGSWSSWFYARPITKRIEPKIEECGQLVTYTWEEK